MAKLIFKQDFTLEVGEETYRGVLNDLTGTQKQKFDRTNKKKKDETKALSKKAKELSKLERKIQIKENLEKWDEVDALEDYKEKVETEVEEMTEKLQDPKPIEDMFKNRLEASVESDDKEEILQAGKEHGYQNVFETILQDIEDKREKK